MEIFLNILFLIIGMVLLIKGADYFVDGSSGIAKAFKVPSLIIGLTLVSIGTSLPELAVSISSSIEGKNELSFGYVVGSNIFNILIVLGLCSIIMPLAVSNDVIKFDVPIYIGIAVLIAIFAFGISPFVLEQWESGIIFACFIIYLGFTIWRGMKGKNLEEEEPKEKLKPMWIYLVYLFGGAAAIVAGGKFTVDTAAFIAKACGMSELLVGLTIVAVGTSLPELITSLVASKKGENDIAVGNAVGSCIFNIVGILSVTGLIHNVPLNPLSYIDYIVMSVAIILIFVFSFKSKKINRWQGLVLVLIYVAYLTYIILRNVGVF